MAITLKYTLHAREKQDGSHTVLLRVTKERVHSYYNTGLTVKKAHWNAKAGIDKPQWVRTGNRSHGELNAALLELLERARLLAISDPGLSLEEFKNKMAGKHSGGDYLAYFEAETMRQESRQPRTGKRWRSVYNHLLKLKPAIAFHDVTHKLLRDYEAMRLPAKPAGSTLNRELSLIKTVMQLAIKEGATDALLPESVKVKDSRGKKDALTPEELLKFLNVELPEMVRGKPSLLRLSRDTYMLQFYLHGARIGDLLLLKRENIKTGRVVFGMQKTDHQKSIEIVPQLEKLLKPYMGNKPYLLPWIKKDLKEKELLLKMESATAMINRNLKAIAAKAEIERHITTHTARHTFASVALASIGNIRTIQKLLGHKKVTTTEVYVRELSTAEMDDAAGSIYGKTMV